MVENQYKSSLVVSRRVGLREDYARASFFCNVLTTQDVTRRNAQGLKILHVLCVLTLYLGVPCASVWDSAATCGRFETTEGRSFRR